MKNIKNNYWTYMHEKKTKKYGIVDVIQNDTTYEVKEIDKNGKVIRQYVPKEK